MMKKNGFTLAEVLITLAVIGVIAALTLPTLTTDTVSAQIGPKLAKAVAMFEQANESFLNANNADSLTESGFITSTTSESTYGNELSKYLKISPTTDSNIFLTKDGMFYNLDITDSSPDTAGIPAHMQRIGNITIDINGNSNPNEIGTDQFEFSWWNDGSLRAKGATNWDGGLNTEPIIDENGEPVLDATGAPKTRTKDSADGSEHWTTKCKVNKAATNYSFCTGHIFENNFKVLYK